MLYTSFYTCIYSVCYLFRLFHDFIQIFFSNLHKKYSLEFVFQFLYHLFQKTSTLGLTLHRGSDLISKNFEHVWHSELKKINESNRSRLNTCIGVERHTGGSFNYNMAKIVPNSFTKQWDSSEVLFPNRSLHDGWCYIDPNWQGFLVELPLGKAWNSLQLSSLSSLWFVKCLYYYTHSNITRITTVKSCMIGKNYRKIKQ